MALTKVGSGVIQDDAVGIANLGATGTASATTFLRGDNAWASAAAGLNSVQTFTASGTYTVTTGVTKQIVFVTGSGGGGGQASGALDACGGGAGGTVIKFLELAATSTVTVAIGAAGTEGLVGNVSTFTTASGTSFTALTGPAGQAGVQNNINAAATLPTGGDMNIGGGCGTAGPKAGSGGSSYWGGGGCGSWLSISTANAAVAFGSGGGAGSNSDGYRNGTNGAAGVVFILEFK